MTDFSHLITDEAVEDTALADYFSRGLKWKSLLPSEQKSERERYRTLLKIAALPHIIAALDKEREAKTVGQVKPLQSIHDWMIAEGNTCCAETMKNTIEAVDKQRQAVNVLDAGKISSLLKELADEEETAFALGIKEAQDLMFRAQVIVKRLRDERDRALGPIGGQ